MKKILERTASLFLLTIMLGYVGLASFYALSESGFSNLIIGFAAIGILFIWKTELVREIYFELISKLPKPMESTAKIAGIIIFMTVVLITLFSILIIISFFFGGGCEEIQDCLMV